MCEYVTKSIRNKWYFLIFLAQVVYPKYNAYCFILYMLAKYNNISKQQQKLQLNAVSNDILLSSLGKLKTWDVNNTVLINEEEADGKVQYAMINTTSCAKNVNRKVLIIKKKFEEEVNALVSYTLLHNIEGANSCTLKLSLNPWKFADEVDLSLISTSNEWSHFVIDRCLRNYFKSPKLLHAGDVISVDFVEYGQGIFYSTNKIINVNQTIYFKCNKITHQGKHATGGYLCVSDKSTLKLGSNVQSFIPKTIKCHTQNISQIFSSYFEDIKKAIKPFLFQNNLELLPIFLLEGRKGSGKSLLLQKIASFYGFHLNTISNFDVSANIYAQNETKLRNILFATKIVAPSLLEIQNFEDFGKNNEGQHDERLINCFIRELELMSQNNRFPTIIFCCTNDKNIPVELRRIFLKTFEIKAPGDLDREHMLCSILEALHISCTYVNLGNLANKTHGFLFEDLKALVQYALCEIQKNNDDYDTLEQHFFKALDFMQANNNEKLGAPKVPKVNWDDVGGLNTVKDEIIKTIKLPLKHPQLLKNTGLKRSGILLYGPPGTGKTLIAKAVATECGLCFLSVKGPELLNMYVGQSEQNVREVFERARDASPSIIFFDELDSLAPNRGASGDSGGVMDRVVSQLLSEMDGLNRSETVFIIGATNRPDLIEPALLRPGRFDKLLYVGPATDRDSKLAVLKALTRKIKLAENYSLEQIVDICPNELSGADFYGICSGAWMAAIRRLIQEKPKNVLESATPTDIIVGLDDFKSAIENVKPSIKKEDLIYFEKLKSSFK